jgi:hypothetical protein
MDVAAIGAAAAQVSAGQRAQQVSIAAIRSSQLQAQSIASILSQSAAATNPSGTVQPPSQPAQGSTGAGNGGDSGGGAEASSNAGQARGSLLNILV